MIYLINHQYKRNKKYSGMLQLLKLSKIKRKDLLNKHLLLLVVIAGDRNKVEVGILIVLLKLVLVKMMIVIVITGVELGKE